MGRHRSTDYEHLCQCGFHGAVDWVRHCIGCESGVPGCTLELGASIASDTKDYNLGDFYPYPGRIVDMGILLASSWTLGGMYRYRCLDSSGHVQFI